VSKTEYFVYGSDGSLYFREGYDGSGNLTEREAYAFLEDEPVALMRSFNAPTGNFFLHNDNLGRPLAMSGTDGFLKWKGEFEPFGKSLAPRLKTSGIEPGFRFPGQWEYGDSGDVQGGTAGILGRVTAMEDNWHRSFAQRWGRYTQPDPLLLNRDGLGLREAVASYGYAAGDPIDDTDPTGLLTCDCKRRLKPFKRRFSVFYHEYLRIGSSLSCQDNPAYGFFPADEIAGTPFFGPGKVVVNDSDRRDETCRPVPCSDDGRALRRITELTARPGPYCLIGPSCQNWVQDVLFQSHVNGCCQPPAPTIGPSRGKGDDR
jgi:RHS repeat-associated protein